MARIYSGGYYYTAVLVYNFVSVLGNWYVYVCVKIVFHNALFNIFISFNAVV